MKILYHHRTMGKGAEGAHIANIITAFEELGHDVIILSPPGVDPLSDIGARPLDKTESEVSGIHVFWKFISQKAPQILFEFLEIFYNLYAFIRLRRMILDYKIDLIYERNAFFLFSGATASRFYNIPLIVEANEVVGVKRARPLSLKHLAFFIEKFTFRRAKAVFTVSSYLKDIIQKKIPDAIVQLAPNAINPEKFNVATRRQAIREKYKIDNKIVIGFAGWFDWWDRLDILINVQKSLVDRGVEDVITMIIGDGQGRDTLRKKIEQLGLDDKVILTGAVEKNKVIDYIDCLDVGVLAHSNDFGSPMILFEMMALGKSIVAPSLKPISDVITDQENGLLFPPLNFEELFRKVEMLIKDKQLSKSLGEAARKEVFSAYTWKKNASNILDCLHNKKSY